MQHYHPYGGSWGKGYGKGDGGKGWRCTESSAEFTAVCLMFFEFCRKTGVLGGKYPGAEPVVTPEDAWGGWEEGFPWDDGVMRPAFQSKNDPALRSSPPARLSQQPKAACPAARVGWVPVPKWSQRMDLEGSKTLKREPRGPTWMKKWHAMLTVLITFMLSIGEVGARCPHEG